MVEAKINNYKKALVEVDADYHIPRLEWNYLDGYNFYVFAGE